MDIPALAWVWLGFVATGLVAIVIIAVRAMRNTKIKRP